MTPHQTAQLKIQELNQALLNKLPTMPTLLREIHQNLKQDPDVVTLLSSEEVGIIVSGLKAQTGTEIATKILSGKAGKSMKQIGLDDI